MNDNAPEATLKTHARDVMAFTFIAILILTMVGIVDLIPTPNFALRIASGALQAVGWVAATLSASLALLSLPWARLSRSKGGSKGAA